MALTYDGLKSAARANHPDWSEETVERWVQSQMNSATEQDRERGTVEGYDQFVKDSKGPEGIINHMSWNATQMGQDISDWSRDLISDEEAEAGGRWGKTKDQAAEIGGDILGGIVRTVGSTPSFIRDVGGLAFGSSKWGYDTTKQRANELQDQGVGRLGSWVTAIEEGANKDNLEGGAGENVFAQTVDQIINNPLVFRGIGSLLKGGAKGVRAISKAGKLGTKTEKVLGTAANIADDSVKASKGGFINSVKNASKSVSNALDNSAVGRFVKRTVQGVSGGPLQPIVDIAKPIVSGTKAAIKGYKAAGISGGLRLGLGETVASGLDTAAQFISNPLSYRLPRIWTYDQSQKLLGDTSVAAQNAKDMQDFYNEHGYSLNNVLAQKNQEALDEWYNSQNIAEDKRITLDEARKQAAGMGDSFVNNFLTGAKDILSMMDPMQYNQAYYSAAQAGQTGTLEQKEYTPRGRIRTSGGLSIDISDGSITDSEGNIIDPSTLTEEQMQDILEATVQFQQGDYSGLELQSEYQQPDGNINITGLDQTTVAGEVIEGFVQSGLLTQATVDNLMHGDKSRDAVYITTQLNESSKEFVHQIVNLYTPEEINNNPQLQAKLLEQFGAYQRWYDQIANVINTSSDEEYGSKKNIYRFRDAMTSALTQLSERDQALINANIYRQAIDYNNSLEEGFDQTWMEAATKVVQATDDYVVNKLLRDDNADIIDPLGLAGFGSTAVNPNVVGTATMLGDVKSALATNAAYLIDTTVVNFINNNLIEGYLGNLVNKRILNKIVPSKVLANRYYNQFKGAVSEMSSEPLENLLDAISMVDSADHNYDWAPGLMIGMLQGGFAGYASSRSNYSTINDYFSDPKNRVDILSRMGIDINKIDDPKKRAAALAITNQMFDNVIGVMKKAYSESNYGVENLAQSLAVTLINNDMADYATDVLDIAQQVVNMQQEIANQTNNGVWTEQQIAETFGDMDNFNRYNKGETFSFSPTFISNLQNGVQLGFNGISNEATNAINQRISNLPGKFTNMKNRAESLIVTSQKIKGNSLQEVFDKMAPHANKDGLPIRPALTKEKLDTTVTEYKNMKPGTPAVQQYIMHQMIQGANVEMHTIGDMLGIGEGSEAWDSKKGDFKKTITRKLDNGKEERISIKDYIIEKINDPENGLTQEQRAFIANMLFRTSVLGINSYFTDSGALSRLGKDFFNSVMPAIEGSAAAYQWQSFLLADQIKKITNSTKSKQKAKSERGAETHKAVQTIVIGGKTYEAGKQYEYNDNDQIGNLTKNGKPYTVGDLKRDGSITYTIDGVSKTITYDNGIIKITTAPAKVKEEVEPRGKPVFNDKSIDGVKNAYIYFASKDAKGGWLTERKNEFNNNVDKYYNESKEKLNKRLEAINKKLADPNTSQGHEWHLMIEKDAITAILDIVHSDDDNTPPPAAPAIQQQQEDVIEGDVEVTSTVVEKTDSEIKETNGDTRETGTIIASDVILDLVNASNKVKANLPRMERKSGNVNVRLADGVDGSGLTLAEQTKILGKDLWTLTDEEINSDIAKQDYQRVTITYKDGTTREFYAVPQLNWATNSQDLGEDTNINKADWFNSFVLLSTNPEDGEYIEKVDSTIFRGPEEELSRPNNNYIYQVLDKDGNPVGENRILNFTRNRNGNTGTYEWRMATCIQLNRLSNADRQRAYKSGKVFVVVNPVEEFNGEKVEFVRDVNLVTENGEQTVKYDYREIYTTSDMVMDPNITDINIGNANIQIADKNLDRSTLVSQQYQGEVSEETPEELQELNEFLVRFDPTRATTKTEKQAVKDLANIDKQYQEAKEEALNDALDLTDDPNVSEEESINEHNKSIDPHIYQKAKARIQYLASEGEGFPIGDYIDLELLSKIVYSEKDPKFYDALEKCIKVDISNFSITDSYNIINKLLFIQERFDYLYTLTGDEDYYNAYKVIGTFTGIVESHLGGDKIDKIVVSSDNNIKDYIGTDPADFIHNVIPDGYSPLELGISVGEDGKILNVNIGNNMYSRPIKGTVSFIHSHPNGSFFSLGDLQGIIRDKFKSAGLVLPGGVFLQFPIDDFFMSQITDQNGNIYDPFPYTGMPDAIAQAIVFSINQGTFDKQEWGEFSAIANDYKESYDKYGSSALDMGSIALQSIRIFKNIAKKLGKDLQAEAVASGDVTKYYMFNKSTLGRLDAEMSQEEQAIVNDVETNGLPQPETSEEFLDNFDNQLDKFTKGTLANDMKDLGLSLETLDSDTISDIILAYVNGKGLEDALIVLANKTRTSKIDNHLKNLLIKNGVLDKKGIYDGETVDGAISLHGALTFAKRRYYGSNIAEEQISQLREGLSKSKKLNDLPNKDEFLNSYMVRQIFLKKKDMTMEDYIKKQTWNLERVISLYNKQQEVEPLENIDEAVTRAISATDGIYSNEDGIIDSLTQYFIEDIFHRNYNTASEEFKTAIKNAVKKQLEEDKVVVLESPASVDSNKGAEIIPELSGLNDEVRFNMAKELLNAGVIGKVVYNYLMKIDPTATILNSGADITNGLLSSVIVKTMDDSFGTDKTNILITPEQKLSVFIDIYRYYSMGGHSYDGLISLLNKKYKGKSLGYNKLISLLEEDANLSKNGLYDQTVLDEISKDTEEMDGDNNPYNVFIRSIEDSNPNKEDIIVTALMKQYYLNQDSFFTIMKFAPKNIKGRILGYMISENDKEHGSNKALGMIMSFLSAARNKEILNKLTVDKSNQEFTNTNNPRVDVTARAIISDWNDDTIITLPEITEQLHRKTGLNGLDIKKGTVLYIGNEGGDYLPSNWETLDGKTTFPLKVITDLKSLNADVNVIVPTGSQRFRLPEGSTTTYNIVRANVGIKDGMMVRAPKTSYANDNSSVGNVISGLGKMGFDININEGFAFTPEQDKKLKQKRLTKNLYRRIFNDIVVPTIPGAKSNLTRQEFNKMITHESMASSNYTLLKAVIASKSPDDKINAATILINQVTNGQLALKTDIMGTEKSIDMLSAQQKYEELIISLLDESDPNYERDKRLLWNFFSAYTAVLFQLKQDESEIELNEATSGSGIRSNAFSYLVNTQQAAMGLLKQLFEEKEFAVSKRAILPGENSIKRKDESFYDTMNEIFKPDPRIVEAQAKGNIYKGEPAKTIKQQIADVDARIEEAMKGKIVDKEILNDLENRLASKKEELKKIKKSDLKAERKNFIIDNLKSEIKYLESTIKHQKNNKNVNAIEIDRKLLKGLYDLKKVLYNRLVNNVGIVESVSYSEFEEAQTEKRILQDINETFDEENTDTEIGDTNVIESENFADRDTEVFATIFNNIIVDNLYDVDTNQITYDDGGNNKFVSQDLLSMVSQEEGTVITSESTLNINKEAVVKDLKESDDYVNSINTGDLLAVQSMISANKYDDEELERILDFIFEIPDGAPANDPVVELFSKVKEKIIRNPDSFTSVVNDIIKNDLVNFDVVSSTMVTTRKPNNDKIKGLAKKVAESVIKFSPKAMSKEELAEAREKMEKYFEDNKGNKITPADDQVRVANEISNMYENRQDEEKKILYVPGFAGVGKSTTVVAGLKRVKELAGAWSDDVERIQHGMKVISDNFSNSDANALYSHKKDQGDLYMKVILNNKECYIKFKGKNIKTHNELKNEFTVNGQFNEDAFIKAYTEKTNNAWTREGLLRLFEVGELNDRGSWSNTRYMIEDFEIVEDTTDIEKKPGFINIPIHGLGNNIPSKKMKDGTYQGGKEEPIQGNGIIEGVYILTKNHSTIQAINDLMGEENGLYGINSETMDSRLTIQSPSGFGLYGYGASSEIGQDKQLSNCLILIDETQGVDAPTVNAIVDGYKDKNNIVMLGDPRQRSQSSFFKEETNKNGNNVIELTTIYRGTPDMQDTNKLNALAQEDIIKSGYVLIVPSDSPDYKSFDTTEDVFNIQGTTMYAVRTNPRLEEVNKAFFEYASKNNKPIPAMVVSATMINKKGETVVDKGLINKRYHEGIELKNYKKANIKGFEVYGKSDGNKVEVFVPVLPNTDSKTVSSLMTALQDMYKGKNISIITTAFAVTTAKESGKTVDNIVLDQEVTNPTHDIYTESNTKDAYDSFTRGDKSVYYPSNATNILFMSMEDIHNLVTNNDPNVSLVAPAEEMTTTEKQIMLPRFYANDGARDARNKLMQMIKLGGITDKSPFIDRSEDIRNMISSLDNVINTEGTYNTELLSLDIQQGKKSYGDKYAVGNGGVLKGIEQQIALLWNSVRADIRNNVSSQKEVNVFNSIDGWVYGKKIKTPNIEQGAFFSSFQYANSELTYDNFSKGLEGIKNGDRGMYLVPKRTVNAKGKEVRSVVPAEISWNVTVVPGILTNNNKENQKQKMAKAHDDRINEYIQAFNDYKNGDKKAITKVSSMLASDLAMHTQDDDFRRKVDIQKPSGAVFKGIIKQEVLNGEDYQIEGISPEVQGLLEKEGITLGEGRNEAIKNYYATMSDYEMELNALGEMNNSIINRLMEGDMSDDLKADLIDFVDAIYNIDNRISTQGEYDSMNQGPNAFDTYSSMSEIDEQTTCKL